MYFKPALALLVAMTISFSSKLQAQPTEVILQVGENITDADSLMKNATLLGIRVNHYFRTNDALMLGYDYISNAKFSAKAYEHPEKIPEGYILNPAYREPTESDADRFYLNILHNFHLEQNNLLLFAFGGLGYERILENCEGLKSQGFINAGGGFKNEIAPNILFTAEANLLQKFDWDHYDLSLSLGIGYIFNHHNITPADPISELTAMDKVTPKPKKVIIIKNPDVLQINQSIKTKITVKTSHTPIHNEHFYVQLAAVSHVNPAYLKKLQNMGESYQLKKRNGVTLLLAGPYKSYHIAKIKAQKLKSIDKGAFVKKMR